MPDPDTLTIALRVSGAVDSLDPAAALLELTGPLGRKLLACMDQVGQLHADDPDVQSVDRTGYHLTWLVDADPPLDQNELQGHDWALLEASGWPASWARSSATRSWRRASTTRAGLPGRQALVALLPQARRGGLHDPRPTPRHAGRAARDPRLWAADRDRRRGTGRSGLRAADRGPGRDRVGVVPARLRLLRGRAGHRP